MTFVFALAVFNVLLAIGPAHAEDAAPAATGEGAPTADAAPAAASGGDVSVELNKLEAAGSDCRAYMVIGNKGATPYQSFKLDLIEFRTDGIIGHRFAIQLGPLRANKQLVKLFDIPDTACEDIGEFLVNDVLECKTESGDAGDCLSKLKLSSRAKPKLDK